MQCGDVFKPKKELSIMSVYAYVRVSTQMQTLENQKYEIENWCNKNSLTIDKWIMESVSGTVAWEKRRLGGCIRKMRKGDLLVCTEISRLGRNMLMIMSILNICAQKGIQIHTIKDNFNLSESIDSKIIAFAFALAAEIERTLISQRTKEALAAKKSAGVRLGRPKGRTKRVQRIYDNMEEIKTALAAKESKTAIAREYQVHRNTLARCLLNKENDF